MTFYNEIDPFCREWIRNLASAGHINSGTICGTSITEVKPDELAGHDRIHLFAGIGGWDYALRLAGWPDDVPVWTGSCPCQPFSTAGQRKGVEDPRHLWPHMFRLIRECRPPTVFGEQVAGTDGLKWLAGIRSDLEGCGYAVVAADLPAAGVGSPHKRQRLFWAAVDTVAHPEHGRPAEQEPRAEPRGVNRGHVPVEHALGDGLQGRLRGRTDTERPPVNGSAGPDRTVDDPWSGSSVADCRDGKARRFEPRAFPLAHGIPRDMGRLLPRYGGVAGRTAYGRNRKGRLRGYGNAIVPQVAALFIRCVLDAIKETT